MDKLPAVVPPRQAVAASAVPVEKPKTLSIEQLKRLKEVTKAATKLFDRYPSSDYDHPKEALAAMVTVLSAYSLGIVRFVTSDETGLQRTCTFPPRLAEIVKACDAAAATIDRANRFANWGRRTEPVPIRGPRPTLDELKAKYGGSLLPPDFGKEPGETKPPTPALPFEKVIPHYAENPQRLENLTREQGTRRSLRA